MKAKIKEQWIDALRSDKYDQGNGRLRNKNEEFCCLGVLCDLYNPEEWQPEENEHYYSFKGSGFSLPVDIQEKIELNDYAESTLISMNDGGESFEDIADWIEENL